MTTRVVLTADQINPDRVPITVNWEALVPGASIFIPCVNTHEAFKQVSRLARDEGWSLKKTARREGGRWGIRIWRIQ